MTTDDDREPMIDPVQDFIDEELLVAAANKCMNLRSLTDEQRQALLQWLKKPKAMKWPTDDVPW